MFPFPLSTTSLFYGDCAVALVIVGPHQTLTIISQNPPPEPTFNPNPLQEPKESLDELQMILNDNNGDYHSLSLEQLTRMERLSNRLKIKQKNASMAR